MSKLSIFIFIKNSKHDFSKCLQSIINQGFFDFEFFCINMNPTDTLLEDLDSLVNLKDNISFFSIDENFMNIFNKASGDYVLFITDDGWFEDDAFEKLYANINSNTPDIVLFNATKDINYDEIYFKDFGSNNFENFTFDYNFNKELVMNNNVNIHTKLFKLEFLKECNFQFSQFNSFEIVLFSIKTILSARKINHVPFILYRYSTGFRYTTSSFVNLFNEIKSFLIDCNLMGFFKINFLRFELDFCENLLDIQNNEIKENIFINICSFFKDNPVDSHVLKKLPLKNFKFYTHLINSKNYHEYLTISKFKQNSSMSDFIKKQVNYKNDIIFNLESQLSSQKELITNLNDTLYENKNKKEIYEMFYEDIFKYEIVTAIKLINKYNLFDYDFYINKYSYDLDIDPLLYYIYRGHFEGHNPSENFNGHYYQKFNENALNSNLNPLVYFVLYGLNEGKIKINENFNQPNAINKYEISNEISKLNNHGVLLNKRTPGNRIIVSLTSFPERMHDIHFALYSLLTQTVKPDEIVLWLVKEDFPNGELDIPKEVMKLKKYGLTIDWCDNMRSYTKLIPSLLKYPNDYIITVDDDIFYPNNLLELLLEAHEKFPNCIICRRSRRISFDEDNNIKRYNEWDLNEVDVDPSYLNLLTGVGGVLYPPGSLNNEATNYELAKKLSPFADDLWFWAMAVLNKTMIKTTKNPIWNDLKYDLTYVNPARERNLLTDRTLGSNNVVQSNNDSQFKNILEYFKDILNIILYDEYE